MGSTEKFCLRWNDFESNLSSAFRDLRADSELFDVSLFCGRDGGHRMQAHRVILAACSPFFRNVLGYVRALMALYSNIPYVH